MSLLQKMSKLPDLTLLRLNMRVDSLRFRLNVAGSVPERLFYITPAEKLSIEEEISSIEREIQVATAGASGALKGGSDCSNDAAIAAALASTDDAVSQDASLAAALHLAAALYVEEDASLAAAWQLEESERPPPQVAAGKNTCPCCHCEIEVPPGWRNCGWFVHGAIVTHRGGRFEEVQENQHLTPAAREDLMRVYPQLPPMLSDRRDGVQYLAGCLNKLYLTENGFVPREE